MFAVPRRQALSLLALVLILATAAWWVGRPASEAAAPSAQTSLPPKAASLVLALDQPLTLPITSFQFGVGRGVSGNQTSEPSFSEVTINLDTAATDPLLYEAAVTDVTIPTATVKHADPDGGQREWVLTDVILSGASWSHGSGQGGANESLTLNFATATLTTYDRTGQVVGSHCAVARHDASC